MIPTQEEAWQSIVDRFPNHTIELGEEIPDEAWCPHKPIIIDGTQTKMHWPTMNNKEWEGSYNGIPTHAELTAMVRESIYHHINGRWGWEEEHEQKNI